MTHLAPTGNLEELDCRESDGIAVSLLWQQNGNRLSVVVEDTKFGTNFTIPARPDNALDVFRRLLAHVARPSKQATTTKEEEVMSGISVPLAEAAVQRRDATLSKVNIPQLRIRGIVAIWAAAALPMAVLAWLVAPMLADRFAGGGQVPMAKALIVSLTIGLVWQFFLVAILVAREQGTLRWSTVREALWLRSPRSPRSGRVGGRVWLVVIPLIVAFAAEELIPRVAMPGNRDFGTLLQSDAGQAFFSGAWGWYGLFLVLAVFNTVLGEELLFRGYLLPRMNGAFGRGDWVANGVLFAGYHLHEPWVIPAALVDMFILAYPTKRYRSAWIGIAVHSAQSVVLGILLLTLVV